MTNTSILSKSIIFLHAYLAFLLHSFSFTSLQSSDKSLQKQSVVSLQKHKKQKQPPDMFREKKLFLEISQNSKKNTCARDFCNKVAGLRCFVVNFVKFTKIYRTPPDDFFWKGLKWLLKALFFYFPD